MESADRFRQVLGEYVVAAQAPNEKAMLAAYVRARLQGRQNYERVLAARGRGEDITDMVLGLLMPHWENSESLQQGYWTHPSAKVTMKWIRTPDVPDEDWPYISRELMQFIESCVEHPEDLKEACKRYRRSAYCKGFQAGLVSPILNAVRPDQYCIVNARPIDLLNRVTGSKCDTDLDRYPAANRGMLDLLGALEEQLAPVAASVEGVMPGDILDRFSRWCQENQADFDEETTWKIAPGTEARYWAACRDGGYIGLEWAEIGDLTDVDRPEFEKRRDELAAQYGWTTPEVEQLWTFAKKIRLGDRVVANRGQTEILALGKVTGRYYYESDAVDAHRLQVDWFDLTPRSVKQAGWRSTLVRMKPGELEALIARGKQLAPPFDEIFESFEDGAWTFEFLGRCLQAMGVGEGDQRVSVSLRRHGSVNVSLGSWIVASACRGRLGLTVTEEEPALNLAIDEPQAFSQYEDEVGMAFMYFNPATLRAPAAEFSEQMARSFDLLGERFRTWKGTPYRRSHRPDLLAAMFDQRRVRKLLRTGAVGDEAESQSAEEATDGWMEPDLVSIRQAIADCGLRLSDRVLRRYHLALKTRGFVILAGVSGTGKTWLAQAYADAVGADCQVVPVAPNWTTNEDLLGYRNPLDGIYQDTAFSRFLRKASLAHQQAVASSSRSQPFHVVLDEMNLARVEHYFAKFLSALELRARPPYLASIELAPEDTVQLPPNLVFIGTVNVDETTHGFADKVYDRAQLIELDVPRAQIVEHIGKCDHGDALAQAWEILRPVAPFAYRVIDEVRQYVEASEKLEVSWQEALDEQILQKLLPKIRGADPRLGLALQQLSQLAVDLDLHLTRHKLADMMLSYTHHGFASYF